MTASVLAHDLAADAWLGAPGYPQAVTPLLSRIHNHLIGGAYTFRADRDAARELAASVPWAAPVMWSARAFLQRAVTYLAARGVDQFADIGCGIPTLGATHEILHQVTPTGRVVYLDCDPVAVLLGQELLTGIPGVAMAQADLCHPDTVIDGMLRGGVDLSRPVGVLLGGVLACLPKQHAHPAVAALRDIVAPGSWLALTHVTPQVCHGLPPTATARADRVLGRTPTPVLLRDQAQVAQFFTPGWRLTGPGLVDAAKWRPDPNDPTEWAHQYPAGAVLAGIAVRRATG